MLCEKATALITNFLSISGANDLLAMLILDEAFDEPRYTFFAKEIKIKILQAAATNVTLSHMRIEASKEGYFYFPQGRPPGEQRVDFIDFLHLHHNIWQSLIKGNLASGLGAERWGECSAESSAVGSGFADW